MRGFLELIGILAMLTALGGLAWAGMSVIASDPGISGDTPPDPSGFRRAMVIAAAGAIVYIVAGQFKKRLG